MVPPGDGLQMPLSWLEKTEFHDPRSTPARTAARARDDVLDVREAVAVLVSRGAMTRSGGLGAGIRGHVPTGRLVWSARSARTLCSRSSRIVRLARMLDAILV